MFDDEEVRLEREAIANESAEFLNSLSSPLKAQKVIFVCALLDLVFFAVLFFQPRLVLNLDFRIQIFAILFSFILGFLIVNAAWRLAFPKSQEQKNIEPGVMSGYEYSSQQNSRLFIWLASTVGGFINFFLAYLFFHFS